MLSFSLTMSSILTKTLIKNWNDFVIYATQLNTISEERQDNVDFLLRNLEKERKISGLYLTFTTDSFWKAT